MATLHHEERLQKLFANVNDWLKFAEAKNFGLLTLNAAIVFGFSQIDLNITLKIGLYIFSFLAVFSFFFSLLSLFPLISKIEKGDLAFAFINKFSNWIDKETQFENIHFYGYLKELDLVEFENKFLVKVGSTVIFTEYEKELSNQILYNSRITWLKYQFFKIGASLFLLGFILCIISLPITLIVSYFFK